MYMYFFHAHFYLVLVAILFIELLEGLSHVFYHDRKVVHLCTFCSAA